MKEKLIYFLLRALAASLLIWMIQGSLPCWPLSILLAYLYLQSEYANARHDYLFMVNDAREEARERALAELEKEAANGNV